MKKSKSGFWVRKALSVMPRSMRHGLYRSMIHINQSPSPDLILKLAETQEELEAAFRILHDAYVRMGYMDPHPSGMRVTKYHALPSTSTLIALWKNEVVGTVSLIRSSTFGLPLESIFELSAARGHGVKVAEVSALAVRKDFSHTHGEILFPMLKFLHEYSVNYFGVDAFAIAVNPSWIDFYEGLLGFERLAEKTVDNYSFVKGAPAVGGIVFLPSVHFKFAALYGNKKSDKNLYKYFFVNKYVQNFRFPVRRYASISDPVMTPQMLDYFFNEKTDIFKNLSEYDRQILHQLYDKQEYRDVLPKITAHQGGSSNRRKEKRFEVGCSARIMVPGSLPVKLLVQSVAYNGLGGIADRTLRGGGKYNIQIAMGEFDIADLEVTPTWYDKDKNYIGFKIISADPKWFDFIASLDSKLLKTA